MFSTFEAALASVNLPLREDDDPPWIVRRPIDEPSGEILEAKLTRGRKIAEITVKRHHDSECGRDWGGELQNGYAHVPHPFKCGDIVRQFGDTYCVLAEDAKDSDGGFPHGADWSDMRLHGVTWDLRTGTFAHDHNILFTKYGTELVDPADLPDKQRMLAAVSFVMRGEYDLITFLQCFTNGDRETLEKDAVDDAERAKSPPPTAKTEILRSDVPGLPANLFLRASCFRGFPKAVRVQRSGDDESHYRDTVELTLEPEPRFNGGTGDLSPEDVGTIRDLVARNLDAFLAHWDGKMPFDELLTALWGPAAQNTKK